MNSQVTLQILPMQRKFPSLHHTCGGTAPRGVLTLGTPRMSSQSLASLQSQAHDRGRAWWGGLGVTTKGVVSLLSVIHFLGILAGTDGVLSPSAHCLGVADALRSVFECLHRVFTSPLFHGSMLHLGLNMAAFCGGMAQTFECERLGSLRFAVLLVVLSFIGGTFTLILRVFGEALGLLGPACGAGFSGVLFGLVTLEATGPGATEQNFFGVVHVPGWAYPIVAFLAASLLMPNADSVGHLGGILAGVVLGRQGFKGLRWVLPSERILMTVEEHAAVLSPAALSGAIRMQGYVPAGTCEWPALVAGQLDSVSERPGWTEGWGWGLASTASRSTGSVTTAQTPLPLWGSVPTPAPIGRTLGGSAMGNGEGELDPLMRAFDRHEELEGGRSEASRAAGIAALRRVQAYNASNARPRSREESARAPSSDFPSPQARSPRPLARTPGTGGDDEG